MNRSFAFKAGLLAAAGAALALLVAVSGVVPITASSGHWAITGWFLELGKRRSVALHALGIELPPLDDPVLVLKGAGHYEGGCRPCHGGPDLRNPRVAASMAPNPPYLPPRIDIWEPAELFYIVKHGIKFTGMPAWPSQQRDDEVRALVAFLLELPALDAQSYRNLVHGAADVADRAVPLTGLVGSTPALAATSCARCHGVDGLGRGSGAFPKLAGQKPDYLFRALQAYARGDRHSGIMEPIAAGLALAEWQDLADYYSALPSDLERAVGEPVPRDDPRVARGRSIAAVGIPSEDVPACMDCHGPGEQRRNAAYPSIAGQYEDYLVLQLELFNEERRGGSAYAHLMQHVAPHLSAEQMRDVAAYYASLPAAE